MDILRARFQGEGVTTCVDTNGKPDGSWAKVAGVVLVRQRPGNGNAIFITLEDESGITNIVLWARKFEQFRRQ
ncbi:OB-fold nucleic acid binding domain-containing protein, partial [Stenotrophomonas maltophilia]|uniref:OB-fold nucleic acid binding domain-containing protein n=1 Tax=Stenotrophomonas maltophilia TaxID=40324 RepID=UPI001953B7D8